MKPAELLTNREIGTLMAAASHFADNTASPAVRAELLEIIRKLSQP